MLKAFDIFPKLSDRNARLRTFSGGIITIIITAWISFLIYGELLLFLKPQRQSSIFIDGDQILGPKKVFIDFDILFQTSCPDLHVDSFQDDGTTKTDIIENISRTRLDSTGISIENAMEKRYKIGNYTKANTKTDRSNYCGSCYAAGVPGQCCNTCHDVMEAYKKKGWSYYGVERWVQCVREGFVDFGSEKCHIKGSLKVKKGTGHFHFGLGSNTLSSGKGHLHDLSHIPHNTSLSHIINSFSIGKNLPDFISPLNHVESELNINAKGFWAVYYYLHIVPSTYTTSKKRIDSYRYSVMYSQKIVSKESKRGLPGVHFYYDFSPMKVVSSKSQISLRTFLTHVGGIIGGAFSFAAIVDALMFSALSTIEGKIRINKIA